MTSSFSSWNKEDQCKTLCKLQLNLRFLEGKKNMTNYKGVRESLYILFSEILSMITTRALRLCKATGEKNNKNNNGDDNSYEKHDSQ